MKLARALVVVSLATGVLVAAVAAGPTRQAHPAGYVQALFKLFTDEPLIGGQVPPREYKWVNRNVSLFVQFDRPKPEEARTLRYVGISIKGTFCARSQPDRAFTHYHRLSSPTYAAGHGGQPGENRGYWLLWVAVDDFDSASVHIAPGVNYNFSPTPPPTCTGTPPAPHFQGPGAHRLTRGEIRQLARFFVDNPLQGGQKAPRLYRWVSGDVLVWLQFDNQDLSKARALRYIGIAKRGVFCSEDRPHADFRAFQQLKAKQYQEGRGGKKAVRGFWHLAVAVGSFKMPWGKVQPGVDRKFAPTRPPNCSKA